MKAIFKWISGGCSAGDFSYWKHNFCLAGQYYPDDKLTRISRGSGTDASPMKNAGKRKKYMKEEMIEVAGLVVDKQRGSKFKVHVNNTEHFVHAQVSGRMRRNRIRILIGDKVDLEMSPYDLTKGRIVYRHK